MLHARINAAPPRIVAASADDLPAIAALAEVVWRAHYPGIISDAQIDYMLERMYGLDTLRHELALHVRYDRAFVGNEFVAFAAHGPAANDELKLHKLYVHPAWQRHGIGSFLLRHVENVARNLGCHAVFLAVNKRNERAIAAYVKNGFVTRESIVDDIGGGFVMDDYVMAKAL